MNRKSIFAAVRAMLARPFKPSEVLTLDKVLDDAGVAREAVKPFDPAPLFAALRKMAGSLDQVQVDSVNAILTRMAGMPVQWVAYVLATAWHEARFKPQKEWGLGKGKPYGKPGKYAFAPYGRGLSQLTHDRNYEWADKRLGLNGALLANFDRALEPAIAADVLVYGMLEGAFASNGKPLSHYGPKADGSFDYRAARQTVNVFDKADLIAGYARSIEAALRKGGWE